MRLQQLRQYILDKKASNRFLRALDLPLSEVTQGFFAEKPSLIESIKIYEEEMGERLHEEILNLVGDKKCKRRKRNRKEKKGNSSTKSVLV